MGVVTELMRQLFPERAVTSWSGVPTYISGKAGFPDAKYSTYAREGYMTNALVYACIEELATSAAEPRMQAMQAGRWIRRYDGGATQALRMLNLLSRPNPFMDDYEFWRTVILHRSLAGNAYGLKVRSAAGIVRELWLLRPDRVRIVPDSTTFIRRYEYMLGGVEAVPLPEGDVIHWKTPHPLDDFYGMPPMMAIAANVDLSNFMRDFVKTYFEKMGIPSAILSTKSKITPDLAKEIKERFSNNFGGKNGWLGLMVLDANEASYTPMTQSLGAQGLVLPDLHDQTEAAICGAFGVPPELVSAVIGLDTSSYGNRESSRKSFWNETLKPLYRELVGPLNRSLVPEFFGVQEVSFDLSTVGALLPDQDALWKRVEGGVVSGLVGQKEARRLLGLPEDVGDDTFFVPSNLTQTPADDVGTLPEPTVPLALPAPATSDGFRR